MPKTLLLGLDACAWPVLDAAAERDMIPTISNHIENGYCAALESTIPAKTVPAWKTLMTGKNPAKLGVFDGRVGGWGGDKRFPLQYDFPSADFWDYLNEYCSVSTCILNGTSTHPPRELDGVMASRKFVDDAEITVYPAEERQFLREREYQTYRSFRYLIEDTPDPDLSEIKEYLDSHYRVVNDYLSEHEVVMLTTMVTDQFEHEYLDGKPVLNLYSYIDELLAQIESNHPDLNVVIVSDHGMTEGPDEIIWINRWLKERGYLVESGSRTQSKQAFRAALLGAWGILPARLQDVVMEILETTGVEDSVSDFTRSYDIDWEASTAVYWIGGIRTNGRQSDLRGELQEAFKTDFGHLYPDDIDPLLDPRNRFDGEYIDEAPALVVNPYLERHVRFRQGANDDCVTDDSATRWNHEHDPMGVLIADGPLYRGNHERETASIYDVMPTLLASYGIEVAAPLDGRIISEALQQRPDETVPELSPPPISAYRGTVEDEEAYTDDVEDHLKSLGYLE